MNQPLKMVGKGALVLEESDDSLEFLWMPKKGMGLFYHCDDTVRERKGKSTRNNLFQINFNFQWIN